MHAHSRARVCQEQPQRCPLHRRRLVTPRFPSHPPHPLSFFIIIAANRHLHLLTLSYLRYYTHLKREMRSDIPSSSDTSDAHMQQHHTFAFSGIDHVLMKRLQSVSDREFVQISCLVSVAPPPSDSTAKVRKLRVIMETSYPRTVPPPPLPGLVWKLCENKFIEQ